MEYTVPVKMPRSMKYGNNYFEFPSRKLNRTVTAFSNLEYWNQICLEMNYQVEKYCEQPLKTEVFFDGRTYETIFDMWVKYNNGCEEFQEIKYAQELEKEDAITGRNYRQIAIQKAWCEQNGKSHIVKTDKDIIIGTHYIRNLLYLYPKALRFEGTDVIAEKHILKFVKDSGSITVGRLINSGIISAQNGLDILANLYYMGKIMFSNITDNPFGFMTEVYINGK